jgi:hypothetical protein
MNNAHLEQFASLPMVLTTAQMVEGIRGILAVARSEADVPSIDVAETLVAMLARDNSSPEPIDVAVFRDVEDWVVAHWREDSPKLIDAMSSLVLTCGMTRGLALLEKATESTNDEVRAIAQDALAEAARDRLKGWRPVT